MRETSIKILYQIAEIYEQNLIKWNIKIMEEKPQKKLVVNTLKCTKYTPVSFIKALDNGKFVLGAPHGSGMETRDKYSIIFMIFSSSNLPFHRCTDIR